jgi:hypothetical protein
VIAIVIGGFGIGGTAFADQPAHPPHPGHPPKPIQPVDPDRKPPGQYNVNSNRPA